MSNLTQTEQKNMESQEGDKDPIEYLFRYVHYFSEKDQEFAQLVNQYDDRKISTLDFWQRAKNLSENLATESRFFELIAHLQENRTGNIPELNTLLDQIKSTANDQYHQLKQQFHEQPNASWVAQNAESLVAFISASQAVEKEKMIQNVRRIQLAYRSEHILNQIVADVNSWKQRVEVGQSGFNQDQNTALRQRLHLYRSGGRQETFETEGYLVGANDPLLDKRLHLDPEVIRFVQYPGLLTELLTIQNKLIQCKDTGDWSYFTGKQGLSTTMVNVTKDLEKKHGAYAQLEQLKELPQKLRQDLPGWIEALSAVIKELELKWQEIVALPYLNKLIELFEQRIQDRNTAVGTAILHIREELLKNRPDRKYKRPLQKLIAQSENQVLKLWGEYQKEVESHRDRIQQASQELHQEIEPFMNRPQERVDALRTAASLHEQRTKSYAHLSEQFSQAQDVPSKINAYKKVFSTFMQASGETNLIHHSLAVSELQKFTDTKQIPWHKIQALQEQFNQAITFMQTFTESNKEKRLNS